MGEIPAELIAVPPALIVLLAALRQADMLPDRYTPLLAIVIGLTIGVAMAATGALPWLEAAVGGVLVGGTAVGLHQVGKQLGE